MTLSSYSSCSHLPSAGTTDMCYHAELSVWDAQLCGAWAGTRPSGTLGCVRSPVLRFILIVCRGYIATGCASFVRFDSIISWKPVFQILVSQYRYPVPCESLKLGCLSALVFLSGFID